MASKLSRRAATLAQRYNVEQVAGEASSIVAMARELALARMALTATREAHAALEKLSRDPVRQGCYSNPNQVIAQISASAAKERQSIQVLEMEVRDLEQRCAAAGVTDEDIRDFAQC